MGKNLRSSFLDPVPIQTPMLKLHPNPPPKSNQTCSNPITLPPKLFTNDAVASPTQTELLLHPQLHSEIEILEYVDILT